MTDKIEVCPDCESGRLNLETYAEDIRHRDQVLRVEGLKCWVCGDCGAEIIVPDQIRRGDKLIADARRKADGLLTGDEIKDIRKQRLGISQRDAAHIIGGGGNTFSKYERGEVIQSVAMDRLLRLLARHPGLLPELAADAGMPMEGMLPVEHYSSHSVLSLNDDSFQSRFSSDHVVPVEEHEWQASA